MNTQIDCSFIRKEEVGWGGNKKRSERGIAKHSELKDNIDAPKKHDCPFRRAH